MTIDYGSGASANFTAPVMRIDDAGHGFRGVVFAAEQRQATDFDSGKPKWFHNRKLIVADEPPAGADPVYDYIFHIACKSGRGAFSKVDENGEKVKTSGGRNVLEVRTVEEEDVAVVFSGGWMTKASKSVRLNTGHDVRFKRTTPARDENGDRMTNVECEIEVYGTVDNPERYDKTAEADTVDYGDDDGFSGGSEQPSSPPAQSGDSMPEPF